MTLYRMTYTISTDLTKLDLELLHAFLSTTYWGAGRSRELLEQGIRHSLCFGVYADGAQVGFARVISDYATFAYLADVFILEAHRGQGLSKRLLEAVFSHPSVETCGWTLFTKDAHDLYAQFGFAASDEPERLMRRRRAGAS